MKYRLILIPFLFMFACNQEKARPKDILSPDKLSYVLYDMMQADEFSNNFIVRDSTKNVKLENAQLYEKIFLLHSTTKEQFQKSYKFYESDPQTLKIIFDSINVRIYRLRSTVYSGSAESKARVDRSLKDTIKNKPDTGLVKTPKIRDRSKGRKATMPVKY